jgi:hypothetical protein
MVTCSQRGITFRNFSLEYLFLCTRMNKFEAKMKCAQPDYYLAYVSLNCKRYSYKNGAGHLRVPINCVCKRH